MDESTLWVSRHAAERARQRGYRDSDLDLIIEFGHPGPEGWVLLRKDVSELRAGVTRLLDRLEHLAGSAVIVQHDTVVSVYRPCRAKRRRLLRRAG